MDLRNLLDEVGFYFSRAEIRTTDISDWSVGQQIEHILRSIVTVVKEIETTAENLSDPKLTIVGRRLLAAGSIPRGRAKAPDAVYVQNQPTSDHLGCTTRLSPRCHPKARPRLPKRNPSITPTSEGWAKQIPSGFWRYTQNTT